MRILLCLVFLFLPGICLAQQKDNPPVDLESFIERLFPVQDEDIDYEAIYEALFQLYQNPINLNQANSEVLQASYLLSPLQVGSFLAYREKFGPLISIYELQAIPEFDLALIEALVPFVTLGEINRKPVPFWQRLKQEENAYLLFRHRRTWERRRGFTPADTLSNGRMSTRYLGDPNELYLRFRIQHPRDFSLGVTLEKDAGEQFTWDGKTARYGFNFFSFHFTRYQVGKWRTIALGDFQASFGQGLVFGAGYTLGKGAETVPTVRRSSIGILPYTAALEFGFFRGLGLTRQWKNWTVTAIASHAPRDGRIASALDTLENVVETISSLSQTGLHRTLSEISTKNQIRESNIGGNIQYAHSSGRWQVGANALASRFDRPWVRSERVYNTREFSGNSNGVASVYFNYNWKNFFLFGESAISQSRGTGTVLGLVSSLSKEIDFSLLWRKYDPNFHSFYSSGFAESTRPINEQGLYMGIQIRPSKIWKINAYYDYFKFPWLRYRVYAPSKGYEWLARISYQPKRNLLAFIQIRQEQKDRNLNHSGDPQLPYIVEPVLKQNGMLSLETHLSTNLFIRSRVLWSQVTIQGVKTQGFMALQDIQYGRRAWRLTGRWAIFDAETYDNRLYAFENNVLWTFSIPAFSGRGIRYYILGQYQINPKLTAYLRISQTRYSDRDMISSGLQTIDGPRQTDSSLMIRYFLK
ncbi:helix-hairpin-helix domain-containing protein [Algoriphagus taiwanensis]|uniref:Helix-hairpin-helix domain-containing protein n=2 Tax=Algoriphagus taiwanensis TaxID=1445656 RepID=A0ABQ6PX50_9BACT|nr:helix-hairpin-helix domain-containing protein [Algoriphagus taiwanensis]